MTVTPYQMSFQSYNKEDTMTVHGAGVEGKGTA
jgi:hypothetical protein